MFTEVPYNDNHAPILMGLPRKADVVECGEKSDEVDQLAHAPLGSRALRLPSACASIRANIMII